jgi:hypothetical protein
MSLEMNLLRRCVLGDGLRRTAKRNPGKQALIYYHTEWGNNFAMTNVPGFKERDFGSVKKFITWALRYFICRRSN